MDTVATPQLHAPSVELPKENVAGHVQRLEWIRERLRPGGFAVELGCGTGYMLSLPLALTGHRVIGVDLDAKSVEYGRQLFSVAGADPRTLRVEDFAELTDDVDTVIASEVLEHLDDQALAGMLAMIRAKLPEGGR